MIHHISIPAKDPRRVAGVIAELWQGEAMPFPPFPGAYIVVAGDDHGTAIEVCPLGIELAPGRGDEEVRPVMNESPSPFTGTHAALSVPLGEARIKEIAAREGWRAETFDRGPAFRLVEFWVEDRLLLELLPPEMVGRYLDAMTARNLSELLRLDVAREHEQEQLVA